jgi:FkbM family methyltransferase
MERLDDVVARHNLVPPFLLKIDTQGAELEALEGAQAFLP